MPTARSSDSDDEIGFAAASASGSTDLPNEQPDFPGAGIELTPNGIEGSPPAATPFWGRAKKAFGDASARVSTTGVAVASKAASLGTTGVAKATELGKQTYAAAGNAAEASGATQAIKATAGAVADKLDEVSGRRLLELLEEKLRIQDSYNDILATRLAEALERISVLETRLGGFVSQSEGSQNSVEEAR